MRWSIIGLSLLILLVGLPVSEAADKGKITEISPQILTPPSSSDALKTFCTLQNHNNTVTAFWSGYSNGDVTATYIDPSTCGSPTYPFQIVDVSFPLFDGGGYQWPVTVDIVIYDLFDTSDPCDGPFIELCRTTVVCDSVTYALPNIGTVTLPSPCCVSGPFYVGIEYNEPGAGPFPSLMFDTDMPPDTCINWLYTTGNWMEWYDAWGAPVGGNPVIWVGGETESSGCSPSDFSLEIVAGSLAPWGISQLLTVDNVGDVSYWETDLISGIADSIFAIISSSDIQDIIDTVNAVGFFALDPFYDGGVIDGSGVIVNFSEGGSQYEVEAKNIVVTELNRIVNTVNAILAGTGIEISYTSLSGSPNKGGRR